MSSLEPIGSQSDLAATRPSAATALEAGSPGHQVGDKTRVQNDSDQRDPSPQAEDKNISQKDSHDESSSRYTHLEPEQLHKGHEPTLMSKPLDSSLEDVITKTQNITLESDALESSTATIKPQDPAQPELVGSRPPTPPPKDATYLDPTPRTPTGSRPPSRTPSFAGSAPGQEEETEAPVKDAPFPTSWGSSKSDHEEKQAGGDLPQEEVTTQSELQSIMEQFSDEAVGHEAAPSALYYGENTGSLLDSPIQHPPRTSSLEPLVPKRSSSGQGVVINRNDWSISSPTGEPFVSQRNVTPLSPQGAASFPSNASVPSLEEKGDQQSPASQSLQHLPAMQLPEPDPEPDLPFDFHRFLEQLRHKTADPVAKFLRSFLNEFGKKQWMVHEQVKIINDFLAFITNKMAQCEVWHGVSDAEFDNAREGMEKLVMNRLYSQTFSPAIPSSQPAPSTRGKRRQPDRTLGHGRRGQHEEDVERDNILAQKVRIYGWVRETHLDIPPISDKGRRFLVLAQKELLKIKSYRAPRDKIICVLNCCKVIFGLLRNSKSDQSADSFVPLLIYVVLHANPEHLVSNVQYILRFRNQDKLGGEAGYYISSLMGAVQFIENLDRTNLTVSDDEFERNVEAAVSAIAEKHNIEEQPRAPQMHVPEKSAPSRPEVTPRNSMEGEWSSPGRASSREGTDGAAETPDEKAAVTGLLRTIQRPLSSIGRIFTDDHTPTQQCSSHLAPPDQSNHPVSTPNAGNTPRLSPALHQPPARDDDTAHPQPNTSQVKENRRLSAEDAAARQASAETAEAQKIQRVEHANVVETLSGMFPDLDKDVIDDVVRMQQGRVGLAVDACLALSS
ncbi:MAG: hypothetical protein M1833_007044 [Piccolia ochrophora]|nr:MAG: hypothetical protein M1833_007044 [Piccolia ochrophora]